MYQFMDRCARACSRSLGGIVLSLLIVQTCLSIVGRSISTILHSDAVQASAAGSRHERLLSTGVGSINGAFELGRGGHGLRHLRVFCRCANSKGAHASVDIFHRSTDRRARNVLASAQ